MLLILLIVIYLPIPIGINPGTLRGTDTGVWVGASGSEAGEALSQDPEELLGYSMTGCQRAMLANRISYFYDFKGKCPPILLMLIISCNFNDCTMVAVEDWDGYYGTDPFWKEKIAYNISKEAYEN